MIKKLFIYAMTRYRAYVLKTLNLQALYLPFYSYFIYHHNMRIHPRPVPRF